MAVINLYKILLNQHIPLRRFLEESYERRGEQSFTRQYASNTHEEKLEHHFRMVLYFARGNDEKTLSWNWVLESFGDEGINLQGSPKAVILIESFGQIFAITFGHSYFKIDQFSDKEWAFKFARRLRYTNVRTIAVTNPNSQRNRTVNTYLDYEHLDLGSGEALTKLKAKISLPKGFSLFAETIEIGNSIRVTTDKTTLGNIADIVKYIETIITNEAETVKIPYFKSTKEAKEVNGFREAMKQDIENDLMLIDFSEYQIHATRIVFNDNHEYELKHKWRSKKYDRVNYETVSAFLQEFGFNAREDLLDIRVIVWVDGRSQYTTTIEKLIFYTNEATNSLLSDGSWYIYNEDYLKYLKDSIYELPVEYEESLNYSKALHNEYLERRFQEEHENEIYGNLSETEIRKKIKQKYYKERYYNDWLVEQGVGYSNFDRDLEMLGKHKVEVMDIFKDNSMYAVKFGNSSGKLCYAVDQSLEAIRAYHRRELTLEAQVEKVYLWLVLERGNLPLSNGVPDINDLNLLILKNKLDQWKKEVRLLGYRPMVKINYSRE
ncbi:DUF6119 family protein [Paenibacillus elgii]